MDPVFSIGLPTRHPEAGRCDPNEKTDPCIRLADLSLDRPPDAFAKDSPPAPPAPAARPLKHPLIG